MKRSFFAFALSTAMVASGFAQPSRPAVPIDPVTGILDAFRSHQVVALGEGTHGNEQGHAFRLKLIRDPRFATIVNDIVVESGNALCQEVMDRFIRGESVSGAELRRVWQDTTQPTPLWDAPIYEEFFRAVRAVNETLPKGRQLRVLLGDPPIDWGIIKTARDYGSPDRDGYPAEVIRREVLVKKRRALVIYGDLHFIRKNPTKPEEPAGSIVGHLERAGATNVFAVRTIALGIELEKLQPDVVSWPRPSLALLQGTVLGKASFWDYYPRPLVVGPDGKPRESPTQRPSLPMEEQFDALLYLGPQSAITRSETPGSMCADPAYMQMRLGRLALLDLKKDIDRLNAYCTAMKGK